MNCKTVFRCVVLGVLVFATTFENHKHPQELDVRTSKTSETQYENELAFDVSFPRFTGECRRTSWKDLIQSFKTVKRNYGMCKAKVEIKRQGEDWTVRHTKNKNLLLKVLYTDAENTTITEKLLVASWFVVFIGHHCILAFYIFQLATSSTTECLMRNLGSVPTLVATTQSLLLLLSVAALKPERKAGEARFTTVEFTTILLVIATMFAIALILRRWK